MWKMPLLALLAILVGFQSVPLALAQPPSNAFELDLLFPREGGRYAHTPRGLPIILSLQNAEVAYHFGWAFWWDIIAPGSAQFPGTAAHGVIGTGINNNSRPASDPQLELDYMDFLLAGDYRFEWSFAMGPYCEFVDDGERESRTWILNPEISKGSFSFTVEKGAPTPTFTGTCATVVAVMSYASMTTYTGFADGEWSSACGVTAPVTHEAEPCRATVDAAQETSFSRLLSWEATTTMPTSTSGDSRNTRATSSPSSSAIEAAPTGAAGFLSPSMEIALLLTVGRAAWSVLL